MLDITTAIQRRKVVATPARGGVLAARTPRFARLPEKLARKEAFDQIRRRHDIQR